MTGTWMRGIWVSLFSLVFALLIGGAVNAPAAVRTWTGAGADALASTGGNWSDNTAPVAGDSVLFNETNSKDCDWDLDIVLLHWTQTADYGGTVTIWTEYADVPGGTGFTNLVITGNVILQGGNWTHRANRGNFDAWDRLSVSVGGDFTLGSGATIDLYRRGFAANRGPGAGVSSQDAGKGASHGGMGGYHPNQLPSPSYGSIQQPKMLGSGSNAAGGGALFLTVGGQATIDGTIQVNTDSTSGRHGGPSGGSIYVRAASVSGSGTLNADGGTGYYSGGGGRIAVIATNSASLGDIETFARSGPSSRNGTAGTIFLQTTAGTELIIDHDNLEPHTAIDRPYPFGSRFRPWTELPAASETFAVPSVVGGEMEDAVLSITNNGLVRLTSDLRLGDFVWMDANATLDLNGYSLFLKANEPAGAFPADYGGGTIISNDGRIVWGDAPATVKLDVYTYNSSVDADPVSPTGDGYYPAGTEVTLTVTPDADYTFLWWKGDVPAGADRTDHPLTFTINGRHDLIPVVANTVDTRTWTGEGANRLASTDANWYPASAPENGHHIVFDATSDMECYWDLDVEVGSWTQTGDYRWFYSDAEGHRGFVWIHTRYPDHGAFTNLAIHGDCILDGGAWTHPANTGVDDATDRLSVTVGGEFRLGFDSKINVVNRGFAAGRGPGAGGDTANRQAFSHGGSHGGLGGFSATQINTDLYHPTTYGSITAPTTLGSGGNSRGGGAIRVHAGGPLTLDGDILAHADRTSNLRVGAAGGSIYLRGATVSGSSRLNADGSLGYYAGGGGRIALILTNATDFAGLTFEAAGNHETLTRNSAAGTIYLEGWDGGAPSVRRLIVDNRDLETPDHIATELMPMGETYDPHPSVENEIMDAALEIRNRGRVRLSSGVRIGDFILLDGNSTFDLNTLTLYVRADEPPGDFPDDYGGGTIFNWGEIIWGDESVNMPLITMSGPNGWVGRDPEGVNDFRPFGQAVTVTGQPDPGYAFVFWEGDIPEGVDRTTNPLVVTMDQERALRALFADADPDTYTWVGGGADVLASTASNWYPNVAPTAGAHIVINATSVKEMHWDLDIEISSWMQEEGYEAYYTPAEGYSGWVVIQTKYPGEGTFTNFVITGDVVLEDGTWTHPHNTGDHDAVDWMSVSIGGDFTLGSNAVIDVRGRGYANSRGPGAGNTAQRLQTGYGASHGGQGAWGTDAAPAPTYGSFREPVTLGSGANGRGGGAIRLDITGNAVVDGLIDADGNSGTNLQPSGSGGSIFLRAAALSGTGLLRAKGPYGGFQVGGGGRIAVILTENNDFGDVIFDASGNIRGALGDGPGVRSAAGTVYLEGVIPGALGTSSRQVRLLVDNLDIVTTAGRVRTPIPSDLAAPLCPSVCLSGYDAELIITHRAEVALNNDMRMRDLYLATDGASHLHLQGYTLYLRVPYHDDWGHEDWVTYAGGDIVWTPRGSIIILR